MKLAIPMVVVAFAGISPAVAQQQPAQPHDHGAQATQAPGHHDLDDASYVRMMRMHHDQGVRIAKLGAEKAQSADVKQFAQRMLTDHQQDIEDLERLEQSLPATGTSPTAHQHGDPAQPGTGQRGAPATGSAGPGMMGGGMMSHDRDMQKGQKMIDTLQNVSGAAFDQEFLRTVAKHHKMAIKMSQPSKKFESPEVEQFAAELVAKQSRELKEIQALQHSSE